MEEGWQAEKTEREVDDLIDRVSAQQDKGSKFPGMSYEAGIRAMYDWLNGDMTEDPMDE